MKTRIITIITCILAFGFNSKAQDLISLSSSTWTMPEYAYNTVTKELDVQMTLYNDGWANASAFSVEFVITGVSSNQDFVVETLNYSGLSYSVSNNANVEQITNLTIDLDNFVGIPSGQYRLEARINDDQSAYETNYNNNIENFGQSSFNYTASSASIFDEEMTPSFKVFPNPIINQQVQISTTNSAGKSFTLLNIQGELIFQEKLNGDHTYLYLPELETGVYIYQIHGENGSLLKTSRICKN